MGISTFTRTSVFECVITARPPCIGGGDLHRFAPLRRQGIEHNRFREVDLGHPPRGEHRLGIDGLGPVHHEGTREGAIILKMRTLPT